MSSVGDSKGWTLSNRKVNPEESSRIHKVRGKKAGHACSKCKQTRLYDAKLIMMPVVKQKGKKYKITRD